MIHKKHLTQLIKYIWFFKTNN